MSDAAHVTVHCKSDAVPELKRALRMANARLVAIAKQRNDQHRAFCNENARLEAALVVASLEMLALRAGASEAKSETDEPPAI